MSRSDERRRPARRRWPRRMAVVALAAIGLGLWGLWTTGPLRQAFGLPGPLPAGLRGRIVATAESQLGYRTDPADTYCNKYSSYWSSGTMDCGPGNMDEEWCADFAAWVWQQAGAAVDYRYVRGDLNSSAASFYEWGVANGTWHPLASGYVPQPGDVAVYGLDTQTLVATHVAVVTGYTPGDRGPDVVNGDGDQTGFSVVEARSDQYLADASGGASSSALSGYVSPLPG